MLYPVYTAQFRRDVQKCQRRGKDMEKLKAAVTLLLAQTPLPFQYREHALQGAWKHRRELHLEPDWLLVYKIAGEHCIFDRFNGVSTKHLNNYLTWNSVICKNSSRNSEQFIIDKVWNQGLQNIDSTLYKDVSSRPSIPV